MSRLSKTMRIDIPPDLKEDLRRGKRHVRSASQTSEIGTSTPAPGEVWPDVVTFDINLVGGWPAATPRFFGEGGVFDAIYQPNGG